jgi:hypothetical protein
VVARKGDFAGIRSPVKVGEFDNIVGIGFSYVPDAVVVAAVRLY